VTFDNVVWYLSIFLGLFLTGIGLPPVPEEIAIASAAAVATAQDLRIWLAWPATVLGIICADSVLYGVGRLWGPRLFDYRWVQRLINTQRRQRIEQRFQEHGLKILLTARLLPPLRTGVFLIAGAIHYPFSRFVMADSTCAIIGVSIFFFGSRALISLLSLAGHWALYIGAAALAVFILYHYYKHLKNRELRGAQPPISILEVPAGTAPAGQEKAASAPAGQEKVASGPPVPNGPSLSA